MPVLVDAKTVLVPLLDQRQRCLELLRVRQELQLSLVLLLDAENAVRVVAPDVRRHLLRVRAHVREERVGYVGPRATYLVEFLSKKILHSPSSDFEC